MKISFLSLIFFLTLLNAHGQSNSIIYLDEDYFPTEKDSATYFRNIEPHPDGTDKVFTKTYYLSGQLESTATYLNDLQLTKHFFYTSFYENGKTKEEGSYNNGAKEGPWTGWYCNGQIKEIGTHMNVKELEAHLQYSILNFWNKDGQQLVTDGNGKAEYYFENSDQISSEGSYKNGLKSGLWKGYNLDGSLSYEETYKKTRVTGISWDQEGNEYSYKVLFDAVKPKDGIASFYNYVGKTMVYPNVARRMEVEGKIIVQFIISKNGTVTNVKIIKGLCVTCDAEVIRVIKNVDSWIPKIVRGQNEESRVILPITFKLTDAQKEDCDNCARANKPKL